MQMLHRTLRVKVGLVLKVPKEICTGSQQLLSRTVGTICGAAEFRGPMNRLAFLAVGEETPKFLFTE